MYTLDSKGLPIPASISSQFKSPSTSSLNSTHTPTIENYTPPHDPDARTQGPSLHPRITMRQGQPLSRCRLRA